MTPPRLRAIDASPLREDGKVYLALRDPEGYSGRIVLLPTLDALIAAKLDGSRTAERIARELAEETGLAGFSPSRVRALVRVLDEHLFLDNARFNRARARAQAAFRKAPERAAFLAGRSYPARAAELEGALEGYFSLPGGPGGIPRPGSPRLTGLVAPHIDYARGKLGYAWAYREVFAAGLADLYVLLGVAHATPPTPLVLCAKGYATPLGPAPADGELAGALADGAPYDLRADELTHRTEHSIEFQAVLLKFAQKRLGGEFRILPILASSCDLRGAEPGARTQAVLERLLALLRGYPGKVCLLAGVDFAHVGPVFGDPAPVDAAQLGRVERQDRASLERLLAQEPEDFLDSVMSDGNARRVCGVSALYAFSWLHRRLFPGSKGEVLHYAHAPDPNGGEVSFASVAFRGA